MIRYRANSEEASPWASGARLLTSWQVGTNHAVGQATLSLGILLRTAAYHPHRYRRMLDQAGLSAVNITSLLTRLVTSFPDHLQWGLTWAELLILHSPGFASRRMSNEPR